MSQFKKIKSIHFLVFIMTLLTWSCSSSSVKLESSEIKYDQRIIFGKLITATPGTQDLGLTYILKDTADQGFFSSNGQYPNVDPDTGYFWIAVPQTAKYFGVRSIYFGHKTTGGVVATLRDEQSHHALLGASITPGLNPIYVGDVSIATEITAGQQSVSGVKVMHNAESAKKFLSSRGLKADQMADSTVKPLQKF